MANRLIHETSPYLLQHAHNPVDWHPWGEEALRRAREENKPILLSIGYSACHWCHVMERESFEDARIAALMNEHFVCVKVDREERPDLDEIYMQATLALNHGQGGWPMTVFLTPDQHPFFAGTYFPPTDRWGRPGFATLLQKLADLWRQDRDGLQRSAAELTERVAGSMRVSTPMAVGIEELDKAVAQSAEEFDARHGGFGHAPKFPPATMLSFLLTQHQRTGDAHTLRMVRTTLDAMAAGGMYDHIAGGFARYSTDEKWLIPHFEKMLYDNALLARTYLEAFQATQYPNDRRVAVETLEYILHEMTSPDGAFYSATDADSEGVEGKFFVWTPQEVRAAVETDEDARRFCVYYDITEDGNWEHKSIPNTPRSMEEAARDLGIRADELQETIDRVKPRVYRARAQRVPPGLDDKVLVAWNGLMLTAMADGSRVLGEPRYRAAAERAADFLLRTLRRSDGGLYRTYRAGKAHLNACLEDYACLAEGLIHLYEAGADARYLRDAVALADRMVADFSDEEHGGFFTTSRDHERLIVRSREGPDGATPSGNAVAAMVLAKLHYHTGREELRDAAAAAIRAYGAQITRYPRAFAKSLLVTDFLLFGPVELALIGRADDTAYRALEQATRSRWLPRRIIAHHDPSSGTSDHPLLRGKTLVAGKPALYICRNYACQAPLVDSETVAPAIEAAARPEQSSGTLQAIRLSGHATAGGTAAYAVRHVGDPVHPRTYGYGPCGMTGWTVSRIGFGGYRTGTDDPEHREALIKALREGCNLIDTSTNYMDGDSERLTGSVVRTLTKDGSIRRDEIVVVTKIGYVQGENLRRAQAREQRGAPYPEMVKYAEGVWHCIHPAFLSDQLTLSLDRLGLAMLDVCLLHNPEYFLSEAAHHGNVKLDETREEFYRRLEAAFGFFEEQVAAGTLQSYGVSSNTLTSPPDDPEATSLSRMLEAAGRAAAVRGHAKHAFRVVQCPMNLLEAGAWRMPNTGAMQQQTLLQQAQQDGIAVLVNRPLNAMPAKGNMVRLAEIHVDGDSRESFDARRERVAALEEAYRRDIAPLVKSGGQGMAPADYFRWAEEFARIRDRIQGYEHWEQIEQQMVAPHINQVLQALGQHFRETEAERWTAWRERYVPEFLGLLQIMRGEAAAKSRERLETVVQAIDPLLPDAQRAAPLSQKALWILASTPGVTSVLNGMRTPAYVDDSLSILSQPPHSNPGAVYAAVPSL